MKNIGTIGMRVIGSMLVGAAIGELIHITTGDPNRPKTTDLTLLYALIIYILWIYVERKRRNSI